MKRNPICFLRILFIFCYFNIIFSICAIDIVGDNKNRQYSDDVRVQPKSYADSIRDLYYPKIKFYNYADSIQSYNIEVDASIPDPEIIITPDPQPIISYPIVGSVNRDCLVGEIDIISGITNSGARTYEVPIKIFEGINGCEPNLSLSYNSQGGASTSGFGWSVGGLSCITRGVKTIYYDGKAEGMNMHPMDPFYLDGIRLLPISSVTDTYIEYKSEQGNIIARGYVNGPIVVYFEVFYPNGSKAIFGCPFDVEDNIQYPISKLIDRFGNTINYQYNIVNNVKLISKIQYGNGRVEFKYEQRQDHILNYYGGKAHSIENLISEINCYNRQELLWKYKLTYTYKFDTSLLTKIDFQNGSQALNPLEFHYGTDNSQGGFDYIKTNLIAGYECEYGNSLKTMRGRFDYNNTDDGIIVFPNYNPYWYKYREPTLIEFGQDRLVNLYPEDQTILIYTSIADSYAIPQTNIMTGKGFIDILCGDLEGKNKDSVIKVNNLGYGYNDAITFTVYKSSAYGLGQCYTRSYTFNTSSIDEELVSSVQPKYYYTGDFNGDGKQEVLAVAAYCPENNIYLPSRCYLFDLEGDNILYDGNPFNFKTVLPGNIESDTWKCYNLSDKLYAFDANGDGKTDICLINETGTHVFTFTISSTGTYILSEIGCCSSPNIAEICNKDIILGEFNGDNLVDIIISASRGSVSDTSPWSLYYSQGNGTFTGVQILRPSRPDTQAYFGYFAHDIDGDGRTDLIKYDDNGYSVRICSENKMNINTAAQVSYDIPTSIIVPIDINNHNRYSQLISIHKGSAIKYSYRTDKSRERLLTRMSRSHKVQDINEYASLIDFSSTEPFYKIGTDASYPFVNICEALMVLTSNSTTEGVNVYEENKYLYENAVLHKQGLGFQGFSKITIRDKKNRITEKYFDPYNHGVLKKMVSPSLVASYTYSISVSPEKVLRIQLVSKTEKNQLSGYESQYSYTYDNYGFATRESIIFSDGIVKTTEWLYTHYIDLNNIYRLGMVVNESVCVSNEEDTFIKTSLASDYSAYSINVKQEFINGNKVNELNYEYDLHGNVIKKIEKPYSQSVGLTSEWVYNIDGQIIKETDTKGLIKQYSYDSWGNRVKSQDCTGTTELEYDAIGRLIKQINPDGCIKNILYSWTTVLDKGLYKITTKETGTPTIYECFNGADRLYRKSRTQFNGNLINTDYLYDEQGNIIKESIPFIGKNASKWINYEYDNFDRPISIQNPSGKTTYYFYSGSETTTAENDITISRTYNSLGQLILSTDVAGSVQYILAADGQPIYVEAPGGIRYWYFYDAYRRQETISDAGSGVIRYKYDSWGNISERNSDGKVISYEYDNFNRLKKVVSSELSTIYTYDNFNRLTSFSSSNGTSRHFRYDPVGRLESSTEYLDKYRFLQKTYEYSEGNINSILYNTQSGLSIKETYGYSNGTADAS